MHHLPLHTDNIATRARNEMIDVTDRVRRVVSQNSVVFGLRNSLLDGC